MGIGLNTGDLVKILPQITIYQPKKSFDQQISFPMALLHLPSCEEQNKCFGSILKGGNAHIKPDFGACWLPSVKAQN